MIGVCTKCGFRASIEAFVNDLWGRQAFIALKELPHPVPLVALDYLGLFRSCERALPWKKVAKLLGEIDALVKCGYVSRRGEVDRNCPPSIWTAAMEKMVEIPTIKRPMKNHSYLCQVAWAMADEASAKQEHQSYETPTARRSEPLFREPEPDDGLLPIERAMMQKQQQQIPRK